MHIWKSEKSDKIGQSTDMYCRICVSRRYLGIPPLTPFLFCGVFSVRYHGADSTDMYGDMPKLESPRKDTTDTLLLLCCTFSRLFYLHNCCHKFVPDTFLSSSRPTAVLSVLQSTYAISSHDLYQTDTP
jgi:hypothetical protein